MSEGSAIAHRDLRRAIEFAVAMGEDLTKRRRSDVVPRELRGQFGSARIPTGALGRLRRAIEQDEQFRTIVAAGAQPDLVDPVGMLWLQQPSGWEAEATELLATAAAGEERSELRAAIRREERRREAAEQSVARMQAEVGAQRATIETLHAEVDVGRADLAKAEEEIVELRAALVDARNDARHARDRAAAAERRLADEREQHAGSTEHEPPLPRVADHPVDPAEQAELVRMARELAERIEGLATPAVAVETDAAARTERRRAVTLPGGLIATSSAAAEFLMRTDAAVLVDGYNVAKLAWPSRDLEAQRTALLDALENLTRRFGTDITVVFDGATVVGAHTTHRRLLRVVYSPAGVSADDVIRDEVRRLPVARAVVVVTNDAEIVTDVRALGANVVPSNALVAVL